ncbi:MAG: type I methionyl aminopeptidase [Bacteroidetes bacterium]|nr:type I methionyl aminopeptidase [Bacteroidota bacterium]
MAYESAQKIVIKTPEQIEGIRKSGALAAATLAYLKPFVQPGVTTIFLDKKCKEFVLDHHALPATLYYKTFPASCCTSVNDVVCHGVPNNTTILREGDILNIDVTTIYNGYFGDTCTMFKVGNISEYASNMLKIAKTCLDEGVKQCYSGNKLSNIGKSIEKYARSQGCSVVFEFCGHGVGLSFHEEPEVSHNSETHRDAILKPGMVFTIEPMINAGKARTKIDKWDHWTARTIDGKLSAQYEHTICITESGYELLTGDMEKLVEF